MFSGVDEITGSVAERLLVAQGVVAIDIVVLHRWYRLGATTTALSGKPRSNRSRIDNGNFLVF